MPAFFEDAEGFAPVLDSVDFEGVAAGAVCAVDGASVVGLTLAEFVDSAFDVLDFVIEEVSVDEAGFVADVVDCVMLVVALK